MKRKLWQTTDRAERENRRIEADHGCRCGTRPRQTQGRRPLNHIKALCNTGFSADICSFHSLFSQWEHKGSSGGLAVAFSSQRWRHLSPLWTPKKGEKDTQSGFSFLKNTMQITDALCGLNFTPKEKHSDWSWRVSISRWSPVPSFPRICLSRHRQCRRFSKKNLSKKYSSVGTL